MINFQSSLTCRAGRSRRGV